MVVMAGLMLAVGVAAIVATVLVLNLTNRSAGD